MPSLPKPTNGSKDDHASRVGALFDVLNGAAALPIANTWTPTVTFATPGNLAVSYTIRRGDRRRIGDLIVVEFSILTASFTHSTASGSLRITGLAESASIDADYIGIGALYWGGITKTGFGQIVARAPAGTSYLDFIASGSGVAAGDVTAADCPTGGTLQLRGSIIYRA